MADSFEDVADAVYGELPSEIQGLLEKYEVTISIEDALAENPAVLGMYYGRPLKDIATLGASYPKWIVLYEQQICAVALQTRTPVDVWVRRVLAHEIGHFLGYDHPALAQLETWRTQPSL